MSLKALELQIAIPKTFDAGKMADQHQQNVIGQQIDANEALKKELKKKQLQVSDTEKTDKITNEKEKQQNHEENLPDEDKPHQEEKEAQHPFKGNFIDFSG
ncbi:RNA polymerase subunit sigma [Ureibacillus aquaedulcis]|uniref:RNA polymerase subunit sigma n=1 Tax=Ureibacillus aquaedulcis TaxID=3058421 RepID=A0ABT8GS75_9BACL|nr:RNA polymerase subunit sigma [Ureibacillus sp. BA0131]MDN4494270.1 RNA polymerase subunit sigma [Ureibacillus sp. BA0131]